MVFAIPGWKHRKPCLRSHIARESDSPKLFISNGRDSASIRQGRSFRVFKSRHVHCRTSGHLICKRLDAPVGHTDLGDLCELEHVFRNVQTLRSIQHRLLECMVTSAIFTQNCLLAGLDETSSFLTPANFDRLTI